ncbi:MAG: ABC transporter transmembrane domain-containing protein [Candidatus Hodarchaeota archaeon]
MMSEKEKKEERKPEFHQPGLFRGPHMMGEGKAKLDHPRKLLWSWIFSHLSNYKWRYVAFGAFLVLGSIVSSYSPLISATMIDQGIVPKKPQVLLTLALVYLFLMVGIGFLNYIGQFNMQKVGQSIIYNMRNELIGKLQGMSMSYFDKHLSGDIISITTNDVDQLNNLMGNQLVQIVTSIISLVFNVVFMFILNPVLAAVAMIAFPIYLISMRIFKKVVTGAFKDVRKNISNVTSQIQQNIEGAKVVQAFGQEEKAANEFDAANQANFQAGFKVRKIMSTFFPLIGLVSSGLTAFVLYVGGLLSLNEIVVLGITMTPGTLAAFNGFLAQFFRPFMMLMTFQQIIESAMAASDRIYKLLEEESELPDPVVPQDPLKTGSISFKNVSFGYRFVENYDHEHGKETTHTKPPGMPQMPKGGSMAAMKAMGMNPMEMMKRVQEFIMNLPEPYKSFFMQNIMAMPMDLRRSLMMQLFGTPPDKIPAKIDQIFEQHGYAVPGTKMAEDNPDLKTKFPEPTGMSPMVAMMQGGAMSGMKPPGMKPAVEKPAKPSQKPQGMPMGMGGPMMDKNMLVMMAKNLAKSLKPTIRTGGGGGGMGGEGGMAGGGGMPGMPGGPSGMVKMLAMMDIPKETLDEFPEEVRNAIKEERILMEREASTGYVLKNVTADIEPGKTVAIVGETGAGKTTFIKLISRFYEVNDGEVLLDGINIKDIKKSDLRKLIGMVPQDSFLFVGTIRENLFYGIDEITPEIEDKMLSTSKFLGLHNFIEALPDKYETELKENASNISIGQRQLIAFARALMTDPIILILDEATSSVDPYTETLIQDALDKAREGRTTIIIAHRLSTIKNADWIYVLGKEKLGIIEQGTHEDLIKLGGKYKKLLDMQKSDIPI